MAVRARYYENKKGVGRVSISADLEESKQLLKGKVPEELIEQLKAIQRLKK